jgi:type II secretory pathway component GspD/PulD (secretin)
MARPTIQVFPMKLLVPAFAFAVLLIPAISGQARIERKLLIEQTDGKYTVAIQKMNVKAVLSDLFEIAGKKHAVDWDVYGEVSCDLKNVELEHALQYLLRQVDATYQITDGKYRIVTRIGDRAEDPDRTIERHTRIAGNDKTIDRLEVENANVRDVLADLAYVAGVNIIVDPDVQGRVSLKETSNRFDVALEMLLSQVDATYTRNKDGVTVKKKRK